jgi:FkbM family methyltransferase
MRNTMEGSLAQLAKQGVSPAHVVDIGAAFGEWTLLAQRFFPKAGYTLVEPLKEYAPSLSKISNARVFISCLSDKDGDMAIHVHKDLVGSSLFEEAEPREEIVAEDRKITTMKLDTLLKDTNGPFLIKIDAQGAEYMILRDSHVFNQSLAIILECSLFNSIRDIPLFDVVCDFMKQKGFVVYDIIDPSYRLLDNALSQINVVFVPETSHLRSSQSYASVDQRRKQNERMMQRNKKILS